MHTISSHCFTKYSSLTYGEWPLVEILCHGYWCPRAVAYLACAIRPTLAIWQTLCCITYFVACACFTTTVFTTCAIWLHQWSSAVQKLYKYHHQMTHKYHHQMTIISIRLDTTFVNKLKLLPWYLHIKNMNITTHYQK